MKRTIQMGRMAKDVVTGLKGIVVGYAEYLTGCEQYAIQPIPKTKGVEKPGIHWLDVTRIVDAGKGIDQSTFGNSPAWPGILFLISLAEAGDAAVLGGSPESEEMRLTTFQEYANGGLAILQEFFSSRPVNLDGLLDFIETQRLAERPEPDLDLEI